MKILNCSTMTRLFKCSLLLLLSSFLAAQAHAADERIRGTVDHDSLFRQLTGSRASVLTDHTDYGFVFAVVGSTPGQGGAFFRSEVTLINSLPRTQTIAAFYFPQTGGTCSVQGALFDLPANNWVVWGDFVAQFFGRSGLGSVAVLATDTSGRNIDASARIDGFSRIYTPIPGFRGTSSQPFPSVALDLDADFQRAYGLRHDADFRTNVFIFNYNALLSTTPRRFGVFVNGINGTATFIMTAPPCSMATATLSGNFAQLSLSIIAEDRQGGWFAFGSTVDNNSTDAWSVGARPD